MKLKILITIFFTILATFVYGESKKITIVHTNDLHSHLLGSSPNIDYTPFVTGDDNTKGGWARIATLIKNVKNSRGNQNVLVTDSGDFLMGSLFHTISREYALELRLLKQMGYDVVGLGNHEFDLFPKGLAQIINSGVERGGIPQLLLSNIIFDKNSEKDDTLENVYKKGLIKPYYVITKNNKKIGFFALLSKNAVDTAPFSKPLTFSDSIKTAKKMVSILKNKEKVDVVICISHGGVLKNKKLSEDEILAKKVSGIDIILGGHTHTVLEKPIKINNTYIVQAGKYGYNVGVMDLVIKDNQVSLDKYELVDINDTIESDLKIIKQINLYKSAVNMKFLKYYGYGFNTVIGKTNFDLIMEEDESNLGNLIADSMKWYGNKFFKTSKIDIAIESNGVIRDDILKGKTGKLAICDVFRSFSLGVGLDGNSLSYPLISFYLTGSDIKKGLEILTSIYPAKGKIFYLQYSGVKMKYNPNRMIFDRVTDVWIGDKVNGFKVLDVSSSNKKLYKIVANIYNATFFKLLGGYTHNILKITPKDVNGNPIEDLKKARIDADPSKDGIQEVKEWIGIAEYIKNFKDIDGDGLSDVPEKYRGKFGRVIVDKSYNPISLLKGGNYLTWIAFSIILSLLSLFFLISKFIYKKVK